MTHKAPDWEGYGRAMVDQWPSSNDMDGSELFDMAFNFGLIREIPGGFDPDEHIDAEGICPEKGYPWYEYNFGPPLPKETDEMDPNLSLLEENRGKD